MASRSAEDKKKLFGKRRNGWFSFFSRMILNPTSLIAILAFCFASMVGCALFLLFGWNPLVSNLAGTFGLASESHHTASARAGTAQTAREIQAINDGVRVNHAQNEAKIHKMRDDIDARRALNALHQEDHDLTQEEQGAVYNQVSTHAKKIESSNLFQLTPDITYKAATCKISEVKDGSFTYCLSPVENHEPRSREQCGFECVPHLSMAEFESAMDIYKAENRLGAFSTNSVGVKAWFKLFNVIGHHNAKEKFALVFDLKLESICSAMKDVELRELESVKNVCGPFYEKPPPLLSDKPFGLNRDLYQVMQ